MMARALYRNHVAEAFGMRDAPTLITRALRNSTMVATELEYDQTNFGITAPIPREEAYLIGLQLLPCLDHDLYFDGRFVRPAGWFPGAVTIYDLRRSPVADIRDPYHSVMVQLPRTALDAVADESGAGRVDDLQYRPGEGLDDPIARHLLSCLLEATALPAHAPALFLDNLALALAAHIAQTYGGMSAASVSRWRQAPRGGLAPDRERRVKELMIACLGEDISLQRLAAECGLSPRHFARAFRQSTGVSPHRWLMQQRVERAQRLLLKHDLSLSEIALECGFADQSHFTRTFVAAMGASPGTWRRHVVGARANRD